MILIVGLGNPGKRFENTRHNVGFNAIDKIAKENNFPEFRLNKKSNSLLSENNDILLVKPQTFMNDSGKAVSKIISNFKLGHPMGLSNLIVIHDDIDLEIGKIKIVQERGSAGHKGVESIIKAIGNKGLVRIRIGIKPFDDTQGKPEAKKIVLKKFSKQEQELINQSIQKTTDALGLFLKEGLDRTMNEYNK